MPAWGDADNVGKDVGPCRVEAVAYKTRIDTQNKQNKPFCFALFDFILPSRISITDADGITPTKFLAQVEIPEWLSSGTKIKKGTRQKGEMRDDFRCRMYFNRGCFYTSLSKNPIRHIQGFQIHSLLTPTR